MAGQPACVTLKLAGEPAGSEWGTRFVTVLDLALVAPLSIVTGSWLWRREAWGAALTGIFLIKAITLMSGFLVADYMDWFAGRPMEPSATIAFTIIYLLVYFFTWNYFAALTIRNSKAQASLQKQAPSSSD